MGTTNFINYVLVFPEVTFGKKIKKTKDRKDIYVLGDKNRLFDTAQKLREEMKRFVSHVEIKTAGWLWRMKHLSWVFVDENVCEELRSEFQHSRFVDEHAFRVIANNPRENYRWNN